MDLTTNYLGLSLRSPLVPSASPLSQKMDNVRQMEQAGASAVVLHSLFEEQVEAGASEFRVDPKTYLDHVSKAKRTVSIPIIANCVAVQPRITLRSVRLVRFTSARNTRKDNSSNQSTRHAGRLYLRSLNSHIFCETIQSLADSFAAWRWKQPSSSKP